MSFMTAASARRWRVFAAALSLAITCPSLVAVPAVLAVDVTPTLTLVAVQSPAYIGGYAAYDAHIDPLPSASTVWFEASYDDGLTFNTIGAGQISETGDVHTTAPVDGPEGSRLIRAVFSGSTGFTRAESGSLTQVVSRRPTSIQRFQAYGPGRSVVLPGTTPVTLRADVVGVGPITEQVLFEESVGATWTTLGSSPLYWTGSPPVFATINVSGFAEGSHTLRARFGGTDTLAPSSATLLLVVAKGSPGVTISSATQVQAHHALPMSVSLGGPRPLPPTGTLTLKEGAVIKASGAPPSLSATLPAMTLGTHTFVASYSGDVNYEAATSAPWVVTVVPDIVEATGVGVSATTFYPYPDGYRDTIAIKGTRQEPLSVAIRIYAPSGALVRSASFVRGAGAYQYAWNGKNASGRVLAPGSYKVVQTLTDAYGTTKAYMTKVYISSKRIYTYTTYVTKTASQYTKRTSAWIGWEFTLPSAAVYKRLWFQVYGRSSGVPPIRFGAWDTRTCTFATAWDPNCTSHSSALGLTFAWYSLAISPTYERSGRLVRGFAYAGYIGTGLVSKARVKVEYGVLK